MRPLVLACATLVAACGVRRLPPPRAPRQVPPPIVVEAPPAPGHGRVLLDVEGHRAEVEIVDGYGPTPAGRALCVTPCHADLAPGRYTLRFTAVYDPERTGLGYVRIKPGTSAYRYRLGIHRRRGLRRFFGITLAVLGGVIDLTAAGAAADSSVDDDAVLGVGAVGLAVTGFAIWLLATSGSVEQAGHGLQWPLD